MLSEKQLLANRQNALKSTGPKSIEGKAVASCNALKHGLLAKEVVITHGEGAEDQNAFDELLAQLLRDYDPLDRLEEMMLEKIAACYWRLRRAHRCEVGLIRQNLDTLSDNYYAEQGKLTDVQIDAEIAEKQDQIQIAQDKIHRHTQSRASAQDLTTIFRWKDDWLALRGERLASADKAEPVEIEPESIRKQLNEKGHSDDAIWQMHVDLCRKQAETLEKESAKLQKEKLDNQMHLHRMHQTGSLPIGKEIEKLLRYETAIERQMYQALKQLKCLQR